MVNKKNSRSDNHPRKQRVDHKEDQQQFETMSQKQNRHGKGRQQNGSDGTGRGRGSNH